MVFYVLDTRFSAMREAVNNSGWIRSVQEKNGSMK